MAAIFARLAIKFGSPSVMALICARLSLYNRDLSTVAICAKDNQPHLFGTRGNTEADCSFTGFVKSSDATLQRGSGSDHIVYEQDVLGRMRFVVPQLKNSRYVAKTIEPRFARLGWNVDGSIEHFGVHGNTTFFRNTPRYEFALVETALF